MPRQELVRKWEIGRGIDTQIERKSFLHGKKMFNNNLITIRLISIHVSMERSFDNAN